MQAQMVALAYFCYARLDLHRFRTSHRHSSAVLAAGVARRRVDVGGQGDNDRLFCSQHVIVPRHG